jgi:hypothetical protein
VEEYFLALGSADKPEATVTDDSLDSPLHGHLGERMGTSRWFKLQPGGLRVKSPHAPLGQTYHQRGALSKEKLPLSRIASKLQQAGVKKSQLTKSPY